jgi:putative transcriptional regulator
LDYSGGSRVPSSRERSIEHIRSLLERAGFYVADTHAIRPTSFDLAARRDATLLLVKVLKNIDALDSEEATRLRELGQLFPAITLVVGQNSGASDLDPGVVYTRYGVPIINEETLQEFLEKALPPFLYASPGGTFAQVDGPRLRQLRSERGLSLGTLASIAGVSRRAIQLYEESAGAEALVIERIENYLGETVVRPIDLFEWSGRGRKEEEAEAPSIRPEPAPERSHPRTGESLRDGVVRQLDGMGLEVTVTVRAPFDALARTPDVLLAAVGSLRTALHRAEVLHGLARVAEGHALFVVRDPVTRSAISGLPILTITELRRHRDPDELIEEITEREGP